MTVLLTGGCGFIGSNFVHAWFKQTKEPLINIDKLTYCSNRANTRQFEQQDNYQFVEGDILDAGLIESLLAEYQPRAIVHMAAESHVDRSIESPMCFIETNVLGTGQLLNAALTYWKGLDPERQSNFKFLHVSTDEVFGALGPDSTPFCETTPYSPNSPYSASKAGSDHLARAYYETYKLPVLITNCSNNYGPYQFPEKLIPLVIRQALLGKAIPIYGKGNQIRDWIYVEDHCKALMSVLSAGHAGDSYVIGSQTEKANIDLVRTLCKLLDQLQPRHDGVPYEKQIAFVQDRLGHDFRYAIKPAKIEGELNWSPAETFDTGLMKTVEWYLQHPAFLKLESEQLETVS